MKKSISYFLIFVVLTSFAVLSRSHFTELVEEKLKNYSENEWPEKIYVQTDKPFYSLDDNIWFNGYLVNGITHTKSVKSSVVYVEIINDQDSIIDKKKLFTDNISFSGDFKIGKDWESGRYLLRAYTNYMRNNDSDYFFQKELSIWSADNNNDSSLTEAIEDLEVLIAEKPDLNFYPEGGHLVENIRGKVVVKIKNDIYSKINLSSFVTDNDNHVISQFSTTEFGIGFFSFIPEPNKSYYAHVEVNGSEYKYLLPKALPMGYVLNVTNFEDYFLVNVKSNMPLGLKGTYFTAHQRGNIIFEKLESEAIKDYTLKLFTNELTDGVVTLTLFDNNGNPVCERLIFVDNAKNKGVIEIIKDKEKLGKREKIALNISAKDIDGNNLPSQLSMSMTDMNIFPHNNRQENIKTWLLLNSDLRGEVKNPGYFFTKDADFKTRSLLDLVMMTNGWRRFTWQNLLYEKSKVNKFPVENGITISGTTKLLKKPNIPTSAATRLTILGNTLYQESIQKSTETGKFSFGPFIFFDSIPGLVESSLTNFKSKDIEDRKIQILIDQKENPSPQVNRTVVLKNGTDDKKQIDNFLKMSKYINQINFEYEKEAQRLEEVTIVAKRKSDLQVRQEEMNSRTRYGSANNRLDIEANGTYGYQSVFDLVRMITGVQVSINEKGEEVISISGGGNAEVFLDNNRIQTNFLKGLPADNISFIDMLKGPDVHVLTGSSNGVIAIYSKKGNISSNADRIPGIINFTAKGFYTAREFYAPDYSIEYDNAMKADVRTTLHWEPNIRTTSQNPSKHISFFTSDSKGDYIIEIEGISDSGIPLHEITTFSVQ